MCRLYWRVWHKSGKTRKILSGRRGWGAKNCFTFFRTSPEKISKQSEVRTILLREVIESWPKESENRRTVCRSCFSPDIQPIPAPTSSPILTISIQKNSLQPSDKLGVDSGAEMLKHRPIAINAIDFPRQNIMIHHKKTNWQNTNK